MPDEYYFHFRCLANLWKHKGFDILVTHSPACDVGDGEDLPHHGFACFNELLDEYHPHIFAHGHVHMNYSYNQPRETEYKGTIVLNAYKKCIYNSDNNSHQ